MKKILIACLALFFSVFVAWFIFDSRIDDSLTAHIPESITVSSPHINGEVESPLTVSGEARNTWFFEGELSLLIVDWDGKIIAEGFASAEGEWMTATSSVPFSGTISFVKPAYGKNGTLILKENDPSDNPQGRQVIEIPIVFK